MAVVLFKDGRFKIFDEFSFTHELENGWSLTKESPKVEKPKEEPKLSELEAKKQATIEKLKAKKSKLTEELKE